MSVIRHVATAEGSKKYGLPIGAPIYAANDDAADELLSGDDCQAVVDATTMAVAEKAREFNPSQSEKPYVFGIPHANEEGQPALGIVVYDSAIWHIIEFGSVNNQPYRPMTRAVESVGGIQFRPGAGD